MAIQLEPSAPGIFVKLFRRIKLPWLGKEDPPSEDEDVEHDPMSTFMDSTTEFMGSATDELNKLNRSVRRMAMLQEQTLEVSQKIAHRLDAQDQAQLAQRTLSAGVSLSTRDMLACMDRVDILLRATDSNSHTWEGLTSLKNLLLESSRWTAVAESGILATAPEVRIAETVSCPGVVPGGVVEILQQGYRERNGDLIRDAVVVVATESVAEPYEDGGEVICLN